MAVGTLSLTNGSAQVAGTETTFNTDLSNGDFILVTVGGTSYFLAVQLVSNDTSITLTGNYTGPTESGVSYSVVPQGAYSQIPVGLVSESARALRAQNLDKVNWQQVFSVDGDITVTLVDGSTFTGISWLKASKGINAVDIENAQAIADASAASAAASANSATAASNSETAAAGSAQNSADSATASAGSASDSADSAAAAAQSESNASASQSAAANSESAASASQSAAADSATASAGSAGDSADSAAAALASQNAAAQSANDSASSASAAATSETNAATSESNAADSATAAATSESNAATSEANAAASADSAASHDQNLSDAVSSASASATTATEQADRAQSVADGLTDLGELALALESVDGGNVAVKGSLTASALVGDDVYSAITLQATYDETAGAGGEIVLTDSSDRTTDDDGNVTVNPVVKTWNLPEGDGTLLTQESAAIESVVSNNVTFKGSVGVGVEASTDNQLVSLRQLTAAVAAAGSGGPTLTGVMNNFLGAVEWFNGTRAALPSGHLSADGQLLNRADYPDLWNAVNSGIFVSISEDDWQADQESRGNYSQGDGSTTFRLPDLNGVQTGSIASAFLRGNAGSAGAVGSHGDTGTIKLPALPAITGTFGQNVFSTTATIYEASSGHATGAFSGTDFTTNYYGLGNISAQTGSSALYPKQFSFDASRLSAIYGRDSVGEVRPNSAVGIWLIRVNGLYSASNTVFDVITADDALQSSGVVSHGGAINSLYQAAGADQLTARFRSQFTSGGEHSALIEIVDSSGSATTTDVVEFRKSGIVYKEASGTGATNDRNGGNFRSETTQSYGQMRAYRNSSDGGLVFQVSQDGAASNNFYMVGDGRFVTQSSIYALSGDITASNGGMVVLATPTTGNVGDFLNASSVRSILGGRGAYGDTRGAIFGFYTQEWVGNYSQGILNFNGFSTDLNWFFRQTGETFTPQGTVSVSGSDVRLKTNIVEAIDGAGERIDKIGLVEFEWISSGKKERGYLAQQLEQIDTCYTHLGGEGTDVNGEKFEILNVSDRAIMADMIVCIQELRQQVADLQSQVTALQN